MECTPEIQRDLAIRAEAADLALRRRLDRAKAESELPAEADCAGLARFIAKMIQGMAIQTASGASRAQLQRVIDTAMQAWPEKSRRRARA